LEIIPLLIPTTFRTGPNSVDLQKQLEDATAGIEIADELAVTNTIELQMGRQPIEGPTPERARQLVERLADQYETVERARTHLNNQRAALEKEMEFASAVRENVRVSSQADPRINALCARFFDCQRELIDLRRCMEVAAKLGAVPDRYRRWQDVVLPDYDYIDQISWKAWEAAFNALASDPTTQFRNVRDG
jgi:hypothetical protein